MKNSKESHNLTRQNEKTVQKSQKHDANLQKNSTLFFQVGLIMCLLAAYGALEMRFQETVFADVVLNDNPNVEDYLYAPNFFVEPDAVETIEPQKTQPVHPVDPEIIPDDTPDKEETDKLVSDIVQPTKLVGEKKPAINPDDFDVVKVPEEVHVNFVEMVPIYPGCENAKNNNQRRKCMSEKLSKLVKRKFDTDLGSELGLKEGTQRINVNFRINKEGIIEIVSVRAPHYKLEKEALRVVDKVPQMIPGKQGGKPVSVLYTLPIAFNLQY